jgi:hypothetical protein
MALFLFPPFFYYVRRQKFVQTLGVLLLWSLLQFGAIVAFGLLFPGFIDKLAGAGTWAINPLSETLQAEGMTKAITSSGLDLLFVGVLSGVSGGALSIVAGIIEVNSIALATAKIFGSSGLSAALLSVKPWAVLIGIGHAMTIIAVASLFYAKLEKRKPDWEPVTRWLILGLAFVALGVYLELAISQTWNNALGAVIAATK